MGGELERTPCSPTLGSRKAVRNSGANGMLAVDANGAVGGAAFADFALFDALAGTSLSDLLGSGRLLVSRGCGAARVES
jgi:hypothetical protein